MELAGDFSVAIARLLIAVLSLLNYVLIARIVISWVNADPHNPIVQTLYRITEPILYPIRKRLPDAGGLDMSPIVVFLAIYFFQQLIVEIMT